MEPRNRGVMSKVIDITIGLGRPALPEGTGADVEALGADLVTTKLFPPLSGGQFVERRRLLDFFAPSALKRLTLVTAPAGFGKTTLMAHGYRALTQAGAATAWVSLDEDDTDPRRFLAYVIAGFEAAGLPSDDRLHALLDSASAFNLSGILRRLVNLVSARRDPVVLFVDDYHRADGAALAEVGEALLSSAPPNFYLVIASRTVPRLPLASLRVHDCVTDVDAQVLKFDTDEASAFIRDARGLSLSPDQIDMLRKRTEGWVAGLQLAALALKTRGVGAGGVGVGDNEAEWMASFSGDARDVADYLASEVLDALPEDWRGFLLGTSVLERMNAALCNELTGRGDAQEKLESLEANNLFVVPLDHNRTWYRYHHMFRDFLRARLRRVDEGAFQTLCERAARGLERNGSLAEALECYLLGGHEEAAARIVEGYTLHLMGLGRMPDLIGWIHRLPRHVVARRPRLSMSLCWGLFHTRRHREAAAALHRAEAIIEALDATGQMADPAERRDIFDELEVLKSGIALSADDTDTSFAITDRLLREFAGRADFWMATINNIHGYACYARSDFERARASLDRARRIHGDKDSVFGIAYADIFEGQLEAVQGNLHQAYALFQKAREKARAASGLPPNMEAIAAVMQASVLYEWNRLAEARDLLDASLELTTDYGHPDGPFIGLVSGARVAMAAGDETEAEALLSEARSLGRDGGPDRLVLMSDLEYMRFFLLHDRLEEAVQIARGHGVSLGDAGSVGAQGASEWASEWAGDWDRCAFLRGLMRLRLLTAVGEHEPALVLADRLTALVRRVGRKTRLLQVLVQSAIILGTMGRRAEALARIREALSIGQAEGFVRSFVDEGVPIADLLEAFESEARTSGPGGEPLRIYARRLLQAFRDGDGLSRPGARNPEIPVSDEPGGFLSDPLSGRERDILRLLAVGRPNRAIAEELRISENTVKWHLKNIYDKLGVENRTAAVLAAQSLDLIR